MSEWISVKDRLPLDTRDVLCTDGLGVFIAFLYDDKSGFNIGDKYFDDPITHWMPLPPPPDSHA